MSVQLSFDRKGAGAYVIQFPTLIQLCIPCTTPSASALPLCFRSSSDLQSPPRLSAIDRSLINGPFILQVPPFNVSTVDIFTGLDPFVTYTDKHHCGHYHQIRVRRILDNIEINIEWLEDEEAFLLQPPSNKNDASMMRMQVQALNLKTKRTLRALMESHQHSCSFFFF
jgi:hypothetical protein